MFLKIKPFLFIMIVLFTIFLVPFANATDIPKEKLLSMADRFLREKKIPWGTATQVRKTTTPCNAMIPTSNDHYRDERWQGCYLVLFPSTQVEINLKGEKTVVISLDGSQVGLTPRD